MAVNSRAWIRKQQLAVSKQIEIVVRAVSREWQRGLQLYSKQHSTRQQSRLRLCLKQQLAVSKQIEIVVRAVSREWQRGLQTDL